MLMYLLFANRFPENMAISLRASDLSWLGWLEREQSKVAAIVAVHPPKFHFFLDFMKHWENCKEGQTVMDLMPIFNNQSDADAFVTALRKQGSSVNLHIPLLTQEMPEGARIAAWKKFDGLAQVLTNFNHKGYEFALMLDAELGFNRCSKIKNLLQFLREKQAKKIWYGSHGHHEYSVATGNTCCAFVRRSACALYSDDKEPYEFEATKKGYDHVKCKHPDIMAKLAKETDNFKLWTHWTDAPYVHIETARRMFQHWEKAVDNGNRTHLSPMDISASMGVGHGDEMLFAGIGYEHIIYQLYTVAYEGFHMEDLSNTLKAQVNLGENFWKFSEEDQQKILDITQPLWLPCHKGSESANEHVMFAYHFDRC